MFDEALDKNEGATSERLQAEVKRRLGLRANKGADEMLSDDALVPLYVAARKADRKLDVQRYRGFLGMRLKPPPSSATGVFANRR